MSAEHVSHSLVEGLRSMHRTLSSVPSSAKIKQIKLKISKINETEYPYSTGKRTLKIGSN